MARNLLPLLGALALALPAPVHSQQPFHPQPSQAPSSQALVGTWSARVNWNLPSGLLITTSFLANGRVQSTTQNRMGMSFMLTGTYQFNPAQGTLSFKWSDYSPKQTCVGGFCTPAPVPAPMGVTTTNSIRFLNANQFVATSSDGSTTYLRTNAAGFPTP